RARSVVLGRAGKQRVDRRPAPVHARAARERDIAAPNEKMMVRWGNVNFAGADRLAMLGVMRWQALVSVENTRKLAGIGADVQNAQDRGGYFGRKIGEQLLHRLEASVRGADHDDSKTAGGLLLHITQRPAQGPVPERKRAHAARSSGELGFRGGIGSATKRQQCREPHTRAAR